MAELKMLTEMGFPADMAREALSAAGGNVEMALELLTSDHHTGIYSLKFKIHPLSGLLLWLFKFHSSLIASSSQTCC